MSDVISMPNKKVHTIDDEKDLTNIDVQVIKHPDGRIEVHIHEEHKDIEVTRGMPTKGGK